MSTALAPGSFLCSRSQSAVSSISAMESPPPDKAIANGPGASNRAMATEKRAFRDFRSAALGVAAFVARPGRDRRTGVGVFRRERGKGGTAFLHLAQLKERQTELEHAVRRARGFGIFLQQFGEIARGLVVILLGRIGDVSGPIQRGRGAIVLGMGLGEIAERRAGLVILRAR